MLAMVVQQAVWNPSEISSDQRGKHDNRNGIPEDTIQYVQNHISSFPTYMSHYS